MSERAAEALHKKYATELIKQLGNKPLYDDQIDKIGQSTYQHNGKLYRLLPQFKGVYSSDNVPNKNGWYVVNTGNTKSSGIHWVGMIRTPSHDYVYDSFGRPTRQILKKYNGSGRRLTESDRDIEQNDADQQQQNICGHLALAWLMVVHSLGIKKALLV